MMGLNIGFYASAHIGGDQNIVIIHTDIVKILQKKRIADGGEGLNAPNEKTEVLAYPAGLFGKRIRKPEMNNKMLDIFVNHGSKQFSDSGLKVRTISKYSDNNTIIDGESLNGERKIIVGNICGGNTGYRAPQPGII
ncbi:MAG: hypothetical protein ABFD12_08485, partial [Syntrophorhabdus sp.]